MKLLLLAKVPDLDAATKEQCGYATRTGVGGQAIRSIKEAQFDYFAKGFVDADIPRDSVYTEDIAAATTGWGLADEQGHVLAEYKSALAAEQARSKATLKLEVAVELEPEKVAVEA